jgi:alkanesulfonate monooxygenase SsuD/methylene tetrahydromethanopterin reductase-like flavin-dependent oxidoreductase (luciferase family)
VVGRFLQADDVAGLREEAARAEEAGAGAIVLDEGPLGDPVVLAAAISPSVHHALVGVRLVLQGEGRHPAVLARDLTALDLVCGGRSLLCFAPPFSRALPEAIALCRDLWRHGEATSDGPQFPVTRAVNRPRPAPEGGPLVALDLTGGASVPTGLGGVADLVLRPLGRLPKDPALCEVEPVGRP